MNKTVTINISGIIFHIEEDAYDKLNHYLNTIRKYFSKSDGSDEIMSDIESRIAELLKEKLHDSKQAILVTDVDQVIEIMGKPEDFEGNAAEAQSSANPNDNHFGKQENQTYYTGPRRFYRDEENKVLGGVCSGVAAYFDTDPLWIRLLLVVMVFGFGTGILLYIILWIIIPPARTTTEKLEMRGEKIDINNISKTVKEGAESIKDRVEEMSTEARKMAHRNKDVVSKLIDLIGYIFMGIGKVVIKVVGVFFVFIAVILTIALVGSLLGVSTIHHMKMDEWINSIFVDGNQTSLLILGGILVVGVPALMFMYKGVKLIFNFKYYNRWLNMTAGGLWLVGLIILSYVAIRVGSEFSEEGRVREEFTLKQPIGNEMILKVNPNADHHAEYRESFVFGKSIKINRHKMNFEVTEKDGKKMFIGFPHMNIVPSESANFELYILKTSRGTDKKGASEKARQIEYHLTQTDSLLNFDDFFVIDRMEKWRNQQVEVMLKVPQGKTIYIDKNMANFIYDVENVTETLDGDMVGRRWKMSSKGLECVDCEGLKKTYSSGDEEESENEIDLKDGEIKIKTVDTDVKIDKHGIDISTSKDKKKEE